MPKHPLATITSYAPVVHDAPHAHTLAHPMQQYLGDVEFASLFGMARSDFGRLPAWKQAALKKQQGLF